ncbi:hypothetical protein CVT24_004367 [Panaeolus cyanescens]|uniref:F-box domain-containing protein n=1 Tax=Panaeolus cyanescens TaxID=181874 RepID=A0A409YBG6_9AGAR|nr:hypothetical protein CVT24_004367 [Panaeolus cyanescens]
MSRITDLEDIPTISPTSEPPAVALPSPEPKLPLTTINHLAPEVLTEIFLAYMFWEPQPDNIDQELEEMVSIFTPDARSAPLSFCGVCSYWRNIAIATPALWSAIAINTSSNIDLIALWLKRSQSLPLSLYLSFEYSPRSEGATSRREHTERLMDMLFPTMPRWKHAWAHLPQESDMRRFLFTLIPEEGKSPATLLQCIHISPQYALAETDDLLPRLSSFPHATLQRFALHHGYDLSSDRIPASLWLNLQQISFSKGITTFTLHDTLKGCPNLRSIWIESLSARHYHGTPTVAHALQSLKINHVEGDLIHAIDPLTAPNLKRLSYVTQVGQGQSQGLQNFFERSGCQMEGLAIVCNKKIFGREETRTMLRTPIFTAIPNFSLRIAETACPPSFPEKILEETAGRWSATTYVHYVYRPKHYGFWHFGWGTLDLAKGYGPAYPFLVKSHKPTIKWTVTHEHGPSTYTSA